MKDHDRRGGLVGGARIRSRKIRRGHQVQNRRHHLQQGGERPGRAGYSWNEGDRALPVQRSLGDGAVGPDL